MNPEDTIGIEVTVTAKDIDSARIAEFTRDPILKNRWCPVSNALARKLHRKTSDVAVGISCICVTNSRGKMQHYTLPEAAVQFIEKFDMRQSVEPITFFAALNEAR